VVGSADNEYVIRLLEPIHLTKHLVDGTATGTVFLPISARFAEKCVNLVYEDDTWGVFTGFLE